MGALGRGMLERGVKVDIVLSNASCVPGNLSPLEAIYGNGWSCADVASEIIKTMRDLDDVDDATLRRTVENDLRVCTLKQGNLESWIPDGDESKRMGNHAKFFLIDDRAYYIGSQNLYVADLAEWGVFVDDAATTKRCLDEYWNPMWKYSYTKDDCDVDEVMDGLDVDRDGEDPRHASQETMAQAEAAHRMAHKTPQDSAHHSIEKPSKSESNARSGR
jgi:phosphatidylserine/phosphatidylglycerophosphate/cardiolipin synthase-like enzyme